MTSSHVITSVPCQVPITCESLLCSNTVHYHLHYNPAHLNAKWAFKRVMLMVTQVIRTCPRLCCVFFCSISPEYTRLKLFQLHSGLVDNPETECEQGNQIQTLKIESISAPHAFFMRAEFLSNTHTQKKKVIFGSILNMNVFCLGSAYYIKSNQILLHN